VNSNAEAAETAEKKKYKDFSACSASSAFMTRADEPDTTNDRD
jgi:hypothetical protein